MQIATQAAGVILQRVKPAIYACTQIATRAFSGESRRLAPAIYACTQIATAFPRTCVIGFAVFVRIISYLTERYAYACCAHFSV